MSLEKLYSELLSNKPILRDGLMKLIMGIHPIDVDGRLMQLSICRRLFSEGDGSPQRSLFDQVCPASEIPSIVHFLMGFFCDEEQLVSFCAKKALLSLLRHCQVKPEWIAQMLALITPHSLSFHGAMYSLQAVTEVLKMVRKSQHTTEGIQDVQALFIVLHREWTEILHFCLHEGVACVATTKWTEQFHMEFLLHSKEILRHESSLVSSCGHCPIGAAQEVIFKHLPLLASLVTQAKYSSCWCLLTQLSRVFSIILKIINKHLYDHLEVTLCTVFNMVELRAATAYWMWQHCHDVQQMLDQDEGDSELCHRMKIDENEQYISALMRKMVLVVLKYTVAMTQNEGCSRLERILPSISQSMCNTFVSDQHLISTAQSAVLELFVDQDDYLVDALVAMSALSTSRSAQCSGLMHVLLTVFNVYVLTARFLSSIQYDHSVLLDLFMSEETSFRDFIVTFVRMATEHWGDLKSACQDLDKQRCEDPEQTYKSMNTNASVLGKRKVDECMTECSDPKRQLQMTAYEYSNVTSESEDNGPDISETANVEADDELLCCHPLHYTETCLDKVVDCFTKLRFLLSRTIHCLPAFKATTELIEKLQILEALHEKQDPCT